MSERLNTACMILTLRGVPDIVAQELHLAYELGDTAAVEQAITLAAATDLTLEAFTVAVNATQ